MYRRIQLSISSLVSKESTFPTGENRRKSIHISNQLYTARNGCYAQISKQRVTALEQKLERERESWIIHQLKSLGRIMNTYVQEIRQVKSQNFVRPAYLTDCSAQITLLSYSKFRSSIILPSPTMSAVLQTSSLYSLQFPITWRIVRNENPRVDL